MENIINNPGLQHLAENIFLNLSYADLKKCHHINQSSSQILDNPIFWINELFQKGLSKENHKAWMEAIQSAETISTKKKHIAAYLKWNLKIKKAFDLPCKLEVQKEFRQKLWNICFRWLSGEWSNFVRRLILDAAPSGGRNLNYAETIKMNIMCIVCRPI